MQLFHHIDLPLGSMLIVGQLDSEPFAAGILCVCVPLTVVLCSNRAGCWTFLHISSGITVSSAPVPMWSSIGVSFTLIIID